jgi:hypothetical protein
MINHVHALEGPAGHVRIANIAPDQLDIVMEVLRPGGTTAVHLR